MTPSWPEQMAAAQGGPGGPVPVAAEWLATVRAGAWDLALELMTPELRRRCAEKFQQAAAEAGIQLDGDTVAALAAGDRPHPAFDDFCALWISALGTLLSDWPEAVGFGSQPRPVDLDHEVLIVVPWTGGGEAARPSRGEIAVGGFLMRRVPEAPGGWQVADWKGDALTSRSWWPTA